jgi:hypothetical protein
MAGLRTVVSQMIGRNSEQMRHGFVHLVIVMFNLICIVTLAHCDVQDFALSMRSHLRERGQVVRNEAAMTIGLSM